MDKKNKGKAKVITVALSKGGTGKTSFVINLGTAIRQKGYKVLLIDLDANSSLSNFLNTSPVKSKSFMKLLRDIDFEKSEDFEDAERDYFSCVDHNAKYDVDFIGCNSSFNLATNATLHSIMKNSFEKKHFYIKLIVDYFRDYYDFIFIDTNNSLDAWVREAFAASDYLISPVLSNDKKTKDYLMNTLYYMKGVKSAANTNIEFLGTILNMYNPKNTYCKELCAELKESGLNLFSTKIPNSMYMSNQTGETKALQKPLTSYQFPYSKLLINLADEIIKKTK